MHDGRGRRAFFRGSVKVILLGFLVGGERSQECLPHLSPHPIAASFKSDAHDVGPSAPIKHYVACVGLL